MLCANIKTLYALSGLLSSFSWQISMLLWFIHTLLVIIQGLPTTPPTTTTPGSAMSNL